MGLADCLYCRNVVDGESAAIGMYGPPERPEYSYIPFVEDLRASGYRLIHLTCFADKHGVQELVDVIHDHDRRDRLEHSRARTT